MGKQELRDLFEGNLVLTEAANKYKGVLATVKGPFGLTEDENRNGRVYTNDFWEHILKQEETSGRLKERAVIGELEHPNSIQSNLGHISHVVTELKLKPESKELYGEADILDTPSGRILHTLFQAGVKVGISSRGAGSLTEKDVGGKKRKFVKKEDYVFGGFDFVSDPSAPNAFPKLGEGVLARLIESLAPHAEQIGQDNKFYESFLNALGLSPSPKEDKKTQLPEDTTSGPNAELDAGKATIADLRSKMRQMVESHREMSSRQAELQERAGAEEDLRLKCDILSSAARGNWAKVQQLGQQMTEVTRNLEAAQRRIDEFQAKAGKGEEDKGAFIRERKLSREVARLNEALQKAQQEAEAQTEQVRLLKSDISTKRDLVEAKTGKLEDFRRNLLGELSKHFNCDLKALVEGLKPGFAPGDAVRRAVECSRILHTSSLPLGNRVKVLEVKDSQDINPHKTAIQERRKTLLRGARGRKN